MNLPIKLDDKKLDKVKEPYSTRRILEIFANVTYYAGVIDGFGSELDAPEHGALEKLLEIKRTVQEEVPPDIINSVEFAQYISKIENGITYCSRYQRRRINSS
ncbi:hypothetical protein H6503_06220 [Candidatus Woesearchaeota archaeon]|nr:hypothetical protein [Candidatus Woesearchaeota archaeon]